MIATNHYFTPPHEEEQPKPELEADRTLHPPHTMKPHPNTYRQTATHPLQQYASPSPCSSRRGSIADLHHTHSPSPPLSSPPAHKPTPLDHRPDLLSSPSSPLHTWRRDSLPSITQLTSQLQEYQREQEQQPPFLPSSIRPANYTSSSSSSRWLEDAQQRRHSIAVPSLMADPNSSVPHSSNSSTCSSPRQSGYATPPLLSKPQFQQHRHSTTSLIHSSSSSSIANPSGASTPTRRLSTHTPYSRSPELRISHKLAERKRRKEMKDLFDDLRDLLPLDKGLKASKWEILSKAVLYIGQLHEREEMFTVETEKLRNELRILKQQ
ncbi:hypothetical protein DM01DRAFT_1339525 [Hesseltinella vesiculosa]|uniref:BHLH domain-containing protein n=1 Tax=Hesseltinella vesiculosa TaxID=101127 RepID=A0A1X2G6U2_9FUNG|nr:hypothetical protein DM01DRAFT_1339525 [Hesseltinella vesiculosa]